MKKKTHRDRVALIDRLEKKYIQKARFQHLHKQQQSAKRTLRAIRGMRPRDYDDLDYEVIDIGGRTRLAY